MDRERKKRIIKIFAGILIVSGFLILFLIYYKVLFYEILYFSRQVRKFNLLSISENKKTFSENKDNIIPVNYEFAIVIPKIYANAPIISNIDPYDSKQYLPVLKKGVAHAKGTSFPGEGKTIYLFAHSTDAFYNVGTYNAVFYLIGKLQSGDEVDIYFKGSLYRYYVVSNKIVSPSAVDYLENQDKEILILQTCYPPGTTIKRLIVTALLK